MFAGRRLLSGTVINYQTMSYASLAYMAPKLKKLTLVAVTQFLKDRIECVFNIDQMNAVRAAQLAAGAGNVDHQPYFIIKATLKSCMDNELLKVTCKFELEVSAADVADEQLDSYLNEFLKGSSTDLGWSLDKYLEEIKYYMSIVNPTFRNMDLMTQWTEIRTRYNLEEILQQKKGMKAWREGLVKKLQPLEFREDETQTRKRFDPEAEAIKNDDVKFYEYLTSTAIPHDLASHFYKDPRIKSSFGSGR